LCGKGSSQPSMPIPFGGSMPVTSSQSVTVPPEVLARYNAINARADQTANQPFTPYSQDPNAFVSPLSQSQQAAIQNINQIQGMTQPYYQQATQMAGASTQGVYDPRIAQISSPYYQQAAAGAQNAMQGVADYGVAGLSSPYYQQAGNLGLGAAQGVANQGVAQISDPYYQQAQQMTGMAGQVQVPQLGAADIQKYMSPYMQQIIDPTMQALRQQQEQAMSGQTGNAIRAGAFGGDRAAIAAAQLAGQQQLAQGQTLGGLLQQGYGQALSTAQQQQGVRQAEMARILQAGRQQADIGTMARQAYEQQQGLRQADLARQLQVAQQQQGLGTAARQAYEQQQALQQADLQRQIAAAQQLTTTGTAARQAEEQQQAIQQADLARMQSAAQLMGTLGTGAQTAALAAAQAQLGAGAVEQQTGQAGLDALLNQFQQERSYPFQVSQFLANIGLGTGAASGSTTTTAQAQPFFSDRRLKEGVGAAMAQGGTPERVGELNSGEGVYSYRLTDPRTGEKGPAQIGLMSDEVRPDAVTRDPQTGYDMVDYDRATANARMGGAVIDMEPGKDYSRGGYARGGVGFAYNSPDSLESQMGRILAMQEGMYKGQKGGVGSLMSTAGYVPLAEISPHRMLEPASAPAPLTPESSKIMSGIQSASSLAGGLDKLHDLYEKYTEHSHGGVAGYARGGGDDSVIPEEALRPIDVEFLKPAAPPPAAKRPEDDSMLDKASGFVDKAGKLASTAGTVYSLGKAAMAAAPYVMSMFSDRRLKEGLGRAEGGARDEEELFDRMLMRESGKKQLDKEGRPLTSPKGAIGIAQVMPGTAPEAAKLAGLPFDEQRYKTDEDYNKALGKAYFNAQVERFGSPEIAAAAYNAGPARVQKALEKADLSGGSYLDYLPSETQKYVAGVGGGARTASHEMPTNARSFYATTAPDKGLGAAVPKPTIVPSTEAASEQGKGIGDFLTSKEFIIPALTGLGAMASSPSRYLGSAILQGVGAGAQSYLDVLGKETEMAKKAAETGEIKTRTGTQAMETEKRKAETLRELQSLYKDAFFDRGGIQMVRLANGSAMSLYEWMKRPTAVWGQAGEQTPTGGEVPAGGAPEAPGAKPISVAPEKVTVAPGIGWDDKSMSSAQSELGMLNTPGKEALQARSAEYRNMVDKEAEGARDQKLFNNEVAGIISEMASKTGAQTPGATGSMRAMIINYGNTISRAAGMGDQFGDADSSQAILDKINTLAGEARVSSAGQQALGSLTKVIGAYPNLDQPPRASTFNAASNMVNAQMKLDRQQHADAYGQTSGQLYSRAGVDFKRANTPAKNRKEIDALQSVMMRDPQAFAAMVSGRIDPSHIEEYFSDRAHGGLKGMSRYFGD